MDKEITIAIVTDWLVTYAGSEKVVKELIEIYPGAEIYSIVDHLSDEHRKLLKNKISTTSFIQKLPFSKTKYQKYLPLMPLAIEQLNVSKFDIIISSSHAVAKGILTGPDQLHISYVHSPIRYAWDLQHQYLDETGLGKGIKGFFVRYLLHRIRIWDYRTANGVNFFIANSKFISRRIMKAYGRKADVIYPPVEISKFVISAEKDDFYITASRIVPYKKVELIVDAFIGLPDKKLVVIGDGPGINKIRAKATNNITIMGYQEDHVLIKYMQKAKAFIFAAEEDFGISPVEAQACGTPVIAFGKGGALETIRPIGVVKPTGLFFADQTVESLVMAINKFEEKPGLIKADDCRENAVKFSSERFRKEISDYIEEKWNSFKNNNRPIN